MGKYFTERETKRKILNRAFLISVGGNILLVAILIILFIIRHTLRDQEALLTTTAIPTPRTGALRQNAGQICLPCDFKGTGSGGTLYESILQTENNTTLCCLQRDDSLQNLILELEEINKRIGYVDHSNMNHEKLKWWRERNHAAHLYASPFSNGITWRERGCKTSFSRNLTLSEDGLRLTIPDFSGAGMYFVYSLFTFDFSSEASEGPIGIHNVYHRSSSFVNRKDRPVLWTSKLGGKDSRGRQTSFLCGVVSLNVKDSIETEAVSIVAGKDFTLKHIDRLPYSNFFGMFKLIDFA